MIVKVAFERNTAAAQATSRDQTWRAAAVRTSRWYRELVMPSLLDHLVGRFLKQAIPKAEWTHAAHLSVGAWHVHKFGPHEAIDRLRAGIRALNDQHGTANTDVSGYHETVTVAYVRLIDQFLSAFGPDRSIEHRVEILVTGPMMDRGLLLRFWSRDLLMSPAARATWIAPDLIPLALPNEALPSGA